MMNHPKIISATAIEDHSLLVEFDNHQKKTYDINPLLEKEMFAPLQNTALFRAVRVDVGGYAVVWRKDIDISEHECGFMVKSLTIEDFWKHYGALHHETRRHQH